ncbi:MAG: redoxin domain-containing protein [Cyanobacteria bacterium SZAS-4]|nr:redoxin domain-containing protein [Cyanobacteria bacterium SZAS-4]
MKTTEKFLFLFTKPGRFFAAVLLEQKVGWAILFLTVIALLFCFARAAVDGVLSLPSTPTTLAHMILTVSLGAVVFCCLYALCATQLGKKFGGKATFKRVFIVGAYALLPGVFFATPQTALMGLIWSFCLAVIGLRIAHGLPLVRAIIVQSITMAVFALFGALAAMGMLNLTKTHYPSEKLVHQPAPNVSVETFKGDRIELSSFKGKSVVVLDFWATWCSPCRTSLPMLAEVAHDFRDRGVVVLAISDDDDWHTAEQYLRDAKIDLVGVKGSPKLNQDFLVEPLPQTVIVDKNGIVQWVHVGVSMQEKEHLRVELERCLAR